MARSKFKLKKSKSRKQFKRYAKRTHKYNVNPPIMRGGIRL
jgi:steroid 5-alpha reductase family enzyme